MKSLYMKVIRGYYPSISSRFSDDLAGVIAKSLKTSPSKRATAKLLIDSDELKNHICDVRDNSETVAPLSAPLNLLNTIKLPKKLLDITKRLPKANYSSPQIIKKKIFEIKIAKGFPEIFEKPKSRISSNKKLRKYKVIED